MEGSGTRIEYRIRNRGADGDHCPENYVFVLMNASSYRHEDGSLKMVVASAADITSTKRAEEMQKQMAEDALES
jgi:PAS domain-containing protein